MHTYLFSFANGATRTAAGTDHEDAQEHVIEEMEAAGLVIEAIVSIRRI